MCGSKGSRTRKSLFVFRSGKNSGHEHVCESGNGGSLKDQWTCTPVHAWINQPKPKPKPTHAPEAVKLDDEHPPGDQRGRGAEAREPEELRHELQPPHHALELAALLVDGGFEV